MPSGTKTWTRNEIEAMDRKQRLKLVNALPGFKSANLVGTQSRDGSDNLAVFSSCIHIGSNPALLGLIFRPDVVPRHTLANIRETGAYTINAIGDSFFEQAHRTSLKYEADESEFECVGLTPQIIEGHHAPCVRESALKMCLSLCDEIPVPANGTTLVVGAIEHVVLDQSEAQFDDGGLDLERLGITAIGGIDQYYAPRFLKQMPYEK